MKVSRIKNSVTYLFLVLFIGMKMAGLHVLTHNDDKDHLVHCAVCDHIITGNHTPVLPSDTEEFRLQNEEPVVVKEIAGEYHFVYGNTDIPNHLFSRPPPASL
ncbi:hypothetical protein [Sinomicrobium sp. M5D2P9]